jgi:hypothetical protein
MINYDKLWDNYSRFVLNELNLEEFSCDFYQINENKVFSNLYKGDYFIKSRETIINTGSSSIYNNIIYPKTGKNLPSFGMDLMAFMEKKVIIVFDFQHPTENYNFDHEIVIKNMGEYKNNTKEIRFFQPGNHFSNYIFVRKCTVHEIDEYLDDFKKYVLTYKEMVESAKPSDLDESVYIDFDTYMHKLDPVSGFMESRFGKEFAKNYVDNFLFPYAKL